MITREDIEVIRMPAFSDQDCFLGPKKAGVCPIKVLRIKNKNISIEFIFFFNPYYLGMVNEAKDPVWLSQNASVMEFCSAGIICSMIALISQLA